MSDNHRKDFYILLLIGNYLVATTYSIIPPFFPPFAISKGLSEQEVGLIFCTNPIGAFLGSLYIGKYMNDGNRVKFIIFGLFCAAIGLYAFAMTYFLSSHISISIIGCLARVLGGMGISFQMTPSYAFIPLIYPEDVELKIAMSEIVAGIGLMSGPLLGSFLYYLGGYLFPFFSIGTVLLIMILFMKNQMEILKNELQIQESNQQDNEIKIQLNSSQKISYQQMFIILPLLMTFLSNLIINFTISFFQPTMSQFLQEQYLIKQDLVGFYMSIQAVTYTLGSFVVTKLKNYQEIAICIGLFLTGFSFITIGPDTHLLKINYNIKIVLLSQAFIGLGTSIVYTIYIYQKRFILAIPMMNEILIVFFPNKKSECANMASVLFSLGLSLGEFTGPIISGTLTVYFGFERGASLTGFMLIIFGSFFTFCIVGWKKNSGKKLLLQNENEMAEY